jgi:hypothetical protein
VSIRSTIVKCPICEEHYHRSILLDGNFVCSCGFDFSDYEESLTDDDTGINMIQFSDGSWHYNDEHENEDELTLAAFGY